MEREGGEGSRWMPPQLWSRGRPVEKGSRRREGKEGDFGFGATTPGRSFFHCSLITEFGLNNSMICLLYTSDAADE